MSTWPTTIANVFTRPRRRLPIDEPPLPDVNAGYGVPLAANQPGVNTSAPPRWRESLTGEPATQWSQSLEGGPMPVMRERLVGQPVANAAPRWHAPMADPAANLDVLDYANAAPPVAAPVEVMNVPMTRANLGQADRIMEAGLTPEPAVAPVMQRANDPMINPQMPEVSPLRDHSTDKPRGFWGKLGHFGEHFAKTFAATPGNIIERLSAGVVGGINPRIADTIEREQFEKPRVYHERARIGKEADQQQARIYRAKQMENIDVDNQMRREEITDRRLYRTQQQAERDDKRREDAAYREVNAAYRQKRPVNRQLVAGTAYEEIADNVPAAPAQKIGDYRFPSQVDAEGRLPFVRLNPETGQPEGGYVPGISIQRYEKPEVLSPEAARKKAEIEVQATLGDRSAELTQRINDMRPSVYQRLGITPQLKQYADQGIPAAVARIDAAEKELRAHVEDAMKGEIEQTVAKRANELLGGQQQQRQARSTQRGRTPIDPAQEVSRARQAMEARVNEVNNSKMTPEQKRAEIERLRGVFNRYYSQ